MKTLKTFYFDFYIKTKLSRSEFIQKIEKALNIQLPPYEGNEYEDGEAWRSDFLGTYVTLIYEAEDDAYYLMGSANERIRGTIADDVELDEINISEMIFVLLSIVLSDTEADIMIVE